MKKIKLTDEELNQERMEAFRMGMMAGKLAVISRLRDRVYTVLGEILQEELDNIPEDGDE